MTKGIQFNSLMSIWQMAAQLPFRLNPIVKGFLIHQQVLGYSSHNNPTVFMLGFSGFFSRRLLREFPALCKLQGSAANLMSSASPPHALPEMHQHGDARSAFCWQSWFNGTWAPPRLVSFSIRAVFHWTMIMEKGCTWHIARDMMDMQKNKANWTCQTNIRIVCYPQGFWCHQHKNANNLFKNKYQHQSASLQSTLSRQHTV